MHRVFMPLFVLMFGIGWIGASFAEEAGTNAVEKAGERLAEGLQETVVGSVQIPAEMVETGKENPLEAVTVAPIEGAKETALQTTTSTSE